METIKYTFKASNFSRKPNVGQFSRISWFSQKILTWRPIPISNSDSVVNNISNSYSNFSIFMQILFSPIRLSRKNLECKANSQDHKICLEMNNYNRSLVQ